MTISIIKKSRLADIYEELQKRISKIAKDHLTNVVGETETEVSVSEEDHMKQYLALVLEEVKKINNNNTN
jgi:hypothetical protein